MISIIEAFTAATKNVAVTSNAGKLRSILVWNADKFKELVSKLTPEFTSETLQVMRNHKLLIVYKYVTTGPDRHWWPTPTPTTVIAIIQSFDVCSWLAKLNKL